MPNIQYSNNEVNPHMYIPGGVNLGSMMLIGQAVASGDTEIAFDITDDYDTYVLHMNRTVPETDNTEMGLDVRIEASGTWHTFDTHVSVHNTLVDTNSSTDSDKARLCITYDVGNAAGEGGSATAWIFGARNPDLYTTIGFVGCSATLSGATIYRSGASRTKEIAVADRIKFIYSSGNVAEGTFSLYGVKT